MDVNPLPRVGWGRSCWHIYHVTIFPIHFASCKRKTSITQNNIYPFAYHVAFWFRSAMAPTFPLAVDIVVPTWTHIPLNIHVPCHILLKTTIYSIKNFNPPLHPIPIWHGKVIPQCSRAIPVNNLFKGVDITECMVRDGPKLLDDGGEMPKS